MNFNNDEMIKVDWPEVRKGDVLMHENGDRLTVERVEGVYESASLIVASITLLPAGTAGWWKYRGFSPYRKADPLPTQPGAYLGRAGEPWLLSRDGRWFDWTTLYDPLEWKSDVSVSKYGPFTRLVPMPTERQLIEVVWDSTEESVTNDKVNRIVTAVMALLSGDANSTEVE